MRKFRRKTINPSKELLSGPGWSAFSEMPEDFDIEAWVNEHENFYADPPFSKKLKHFISYLPFFIKYRVLNLSSDSEGHIYNEDDEEFSNTYGRGLEILREFEPQILEFTERLIDDDRSEFVYLNRRIVYYRKDFGSNPGYARYVEDLDGSNKFEYGWGHESGTREQIIDSISHHIGFECAQIEMGGL